MVCFKDGFWELFMCFFLFVSLWVLDGVFYGSSLGFCCGRVEKYWNGKGLVLFGVVVVEGEVVVGGVLVGFDRVFWVGDLF